MSIATKNGSVILKSGSVAEGCVCCGDGWYCYMNCSCPLSAITSVTVSVTASDYLNHRRFWATYPNTTKPFRYGSFLWQSGRLSGTHTLSPVSDMLWASGLWSIVTSAPGGTSTQTNPNVQILFGTNNGTSSGNIENLRVQVFMPAHAIWKTSDSSPPFYYSAGDSVSSQKVFGSLTNASGFQKTCQDIYADCSTSWETAAHTYANDRVCSGNGFAPAFPNFASTQYDVRVNTGAFSGLFSGMSEANIDPIKFIEQDNESGSPIVSIDSVKLNGVEIL